VDGGGGGKVGGEEWRGGMGSGLRGGKGESRMKDNGEDGGR